MLIQQNRINLEVMLNHLVINGPNLVEIFQPNCTNFCLQIQILLTLLVVIFSPPPTTNTGVSRVITSQSASGGEVKKSNFSTIEGVLGVLGYRHHNMELVSNGHSHQCVISFYLRQNQLCPDHHLHIKKSSYSSLICVFLTSCFFLSSGELLIQML